MSERLHARSFKKKHLLFDAQHHEHPRPPSRSATRAQTCPPRRQQYSPALFPGRHPTKRGGAGSAAASAEL